MNQADVGVKILADGTTEGAEPLSESVFSYGIKFRRETLVQVNSLRERIWSRKKIRIWLRGEDLNL